MKLPEDTRLVPIPSVAVREIENGAVLVDTASGQCFELNRVGLEIWQGLVRQRTLREIYDVLADRYPVDRERLVADAASLADALVESGLMRLAAK